MMETVWSLIQDDEFVFAKLFETLEIFPTLYGTCGTLYVVEELEQLSSGPGIWDSKEPSFKSFSKRVMVAMAIMDLLDELETVFDEPLHLCDVKASHFGISDRGRVKFLDLDSVFLKSILGKVLCQTAAHIHCMQLLY